ncbi:uncharacterized protein LOC134811044 [Bolinopsis microptera]|uniref:uncharacterized protein LOC134811044 n=1 Tax=Bolinopsis microptera TaxID=2820187 RepID=UPI003078D14C
MTAYGYKLTKLEEKKLQQWSEKRMEEVKQERLNNPAKPRYPNTSRALQDNSHNNSLSRQADRRTEFNFQRNQREERESRDMEDRERKKRMDRPVENPKFSSKQFQHKQTMTSALSKYLPH